MNAVATELMCVYLLGGPLRSFEVPDLSSGKVQKGYP